MNAAVVFFSYQGTTSRFAAEIADGLNGICVEVTPVGHRRSGADDEVYVWGGDQVVMPGLPDITYRDFPMHSMDLIVVCSPVWAGSVAPPMRSFLTENEFFRRTFALFTCYAGRVGSAASDMRELVLGNPVLDEMHLREPRPEESDDAAKRVRAWGRDLAAMFETDERREASGE
jgi:flavodoxin